MNELIDITDCVEIRKHPRHGPGASDDRGNPSMFAVYITQTMLKEILPKLQAEADKP